MKKHDDIELNRMVERTKRDQEMANYDRMVASRVGNMACCTDCESVEGNEYRFWDEEGYLCKDCCRNLLSSMNPNLWEEKFLGFWNRFDSYPATFSCSECGTGYLGLESFVVPWFRAYHSCRSGRKGRLQRNLPFRLFECPTCLRIASEVNRHDCRSCKGDKDVRDRQEAARNRAAEEINKENEVWIRRDERARIELHARIGSLESESLGDERE